MFNLFKFIAIRWRYIFSSLSSRQQDERNDYLTNHRNKFEPITILRLDCLSLSQNFIFKRLFFCRIGVMSVHTF